MFMRTYTLRHEDRATSILSPPSLCDFRSLPIPQWSLPVLVAAATLAGIPQSEIEFFLIPNSYFSPRIPCACAHSQSRSNCGGVFPIGNFFRCSISIFTNVCPSPAT